MLLGSLLWYTRSYQDTMSLFPSGMVASFYLICQQGEGHILDDIGFSRVTYSRLCKIGTPEFLLYLSELLENPE